MRTIGPAGIQVFGCQIRWGEMRIRQRHEEGNTIKFSDGSTEVFTSNEIISIVQGVRGPLYTLRAKGRIVPMFDDTKRMDAHFLLDDQGNEQTREEMLEQIVREDSVWMLYVGGGYVPLRVAVNAHHESDAASAFEEWARDNGRLDEIGEENPCSACKTHMTWVADGRCWCSKCDSIVSFPEHFGEYELVIQQVPQDILKGAVTLQLQWPDTLCVWGGGLTQMETEDSGPDRLIKGESIAKIKELLGIQEHKAEWPDWSPSIEDWVSWPVITDNGKVKELVNG